MEIFPEPSPPVTAVGVSIAEFHVTFVHHVAAVDSDHVSATTTTVHDRVEVDTVDARLFDLKVLVVDVKVVSGGVKFNSVKFHSFPAVTHGASHTANPDDLLSIELAVKDFLVVSRKLCDDARLANSGRDLARVVLRD